MSRQLATAQDGAFDVIVVGAGGAGLMAALSAACYGRSVLLLEKGERLGGTTGLSVGTICASATPQQRALGIDDSPDEHFEDMPKLAGPLSPRDNPVLRRLLVDNVPETLQELMRLGIVFMPPIPEPPHRYPRLHAVVPHARSFVEHIARACRRHGVVIRTGVRVERLRQEHGRVTGVVASEGGAERSYRARRAVILSSGDFSAAPLVYKQRFMRGALLATGGLNPLSTGDGQRMGEEAGGEVVNGDLAWGPEIRLAAPRRTSLVARLPTWRVVARGILLAMRHLPEAWLRPFLMRFVTTFLAPSQALFREGAILVNAKGERFCDEHDRPQDHIGQQPGEIAYILFDAPVAEKFRVWPCFVSTAPGVGYAYLQDYERSRRDICFKADSLDALADALGMSRQALGRAAQSKRAGAEPGIALATAPFYALGPARAWIVFSEGGLRVNERLQVLSRSGEPIPGLYAAGSAGQGGVLLEGHGHHLGWAFTSGRLAGRHAALRKAEEGVTR
jgi:fumarate reductase flavoprotein subunit